MLFTGSNRLTRETKYRPGHKTIFNFFKLLYACFSTLKFDNRSKYSHSKSYANSDILQKIKRQD